MGNIYKMYSFWIIQIFSKKCVIDTALFDNCFSFSSSILGDILINELRVTS